MSASLQSLLRGFIADARGGAAMEHGLIVALVIVVLLAAASAMGSAAQDMWATMSAAITGAGT